MPLKLIRANLSDAETIHVLKYQAFLSIYETYQDENTNPAKEPIEKTIRILRSDYNWYYLIQMDETNVGAVRLVQRTEGSLDISPMFILPEFQNLGIGKAVLNMLFSMYPKKIWRLTTILEEARDCHFYERCGFVRTDYREIVNEKMTLVGYEKQPKE